MEGDVVRLCDTKHKTCAMTKNDGDALKQKGLSYGLRIMMARGYGGMACMA
jgi:hypothetical protein